MNNKQYKIISLVFLFCILLYSCNTPQKSKIKSFTNSLGMKMVYIPPGSFIMGAQVDSLHLEPHTDMSKDVPWWNEKPAHQVTISKGFYMSKTEVTIQQFQQFEKDYKSSGYFKPYATGISWDEAHAFCQWLSKKEGKPYRLPTEAEWEYACRAGSEKMFWSGNKPPIKDINPWGLKDMESGTPEWCYDWFGPYPYTPQTDPVGYDNSWGKVIRGGGIDTKSIGHDSFQPDTSVVFYTAANRSSLPPDYPAINDTDMRPHFIGFRVVMGELPHTAHLYFQLGMVFQGVSQQAVNPAFGPNPDQPYFKSRQLIPSPPDFTSPDENIAVGLEEGIIGKLHSGGLAICPNGDLLYIAFSSKPGKSESAPNTTMVATRLRYGSQEWDMPSLFYDLAGLNDQSALLWNDSGKLWFFGGGRNFGNAPFRYTTSTDNGATWSPLTFPEIKGTVGPFTPQPITSAFRGPGGIIYFGCDGRGSTSFLWASSDNGKTWYDTKGRTVGKHTTFILLKDGRILGMGGKNSNIDGYMPECFSSDFGETWTGKIKTPFAALGSNQRPVIIRLKDGKLFMAGDFQNIKMFSNPPPAGITERGSYVALSGDEGKTWKIKKLPDVPPPNEWRGIVNDGKPQEGWGTLGYCVAAQEPNGIIHLVSSKSYPAKDYAMNEAWILSDDASEAYKEPGEASPAEIKHFEEKYPDGQVRIKYSGWIAHDGNFLLERKEEWFYKNGQKQYEVNYHNGYKTGTESYWNADGTLRWTRKYTPYATIIFTTYWHNGEKKSESTWWGMYAYGPTTDWNIKGEVTRKMMFYYGKRARE